MCMIYVALCCSLLWVSSYHLIITFNFASTANPKPVKEPCWVIYLMKHDDITRWKHFPRYWPFDRSTVNSPHRASDAELWCFLWSVPEQTVKPSPETPSSRTIWRHCDKTPADKCPTWRHRWFTHTANNHRKITCTCFMMYYKLKPKWKYHVGIAWK